MVSHAVGEQAELLTLELDSLDWIVLLFNAEQFQVGLVDLLGSVQPVDLAAQVRSLVLPMQLDLEGKEVKHTRNVAAPRYSRRQHCTSSFDA